MKNNPRITKKEKNLIKGALRRVFARSELRKKILEAGIVQHSDPYRKQVKTWVFCQECGQLDAKSNIHIDHKSPVVPLDSSLSEMTLGELVDRLWCHEDNLQRICFTCHNDKSSVENKERRRLKKREIVNE